MTAPANHPGERRAPAPAGFDVPDVDEVERTIRHRFYMQGFKDRGDQLAGVHVDALLSENTRLADKVAEMEGALREIARRQRDLGGSRVTIWTAPPVRWEGPMADRYSTSPATAKQLSSLRSRLSQSEARLERAEGLFAAARALHRRSADETMARLQRGESVTLALSDYVAVGTRLDEAARAWAEGEGRG